MKISDFSKCNDVFELASIGMKEPVIRRKHRNWKEEISREVGLVCFSDNWRHQLMWGHYTKKGEGVCLVFDVQADGLRAVEYLSKRLEYEDDFQFPDVKQNGFREFCSTKSHHWRYEKEQRLFVDLSAPDVTTTRDGKFLKMGATINLVGFVNGPNPCHSADCIEDAFGKRLQYFQCRPAFRDFHMVVQQSKKLWKSTKHCNSQVHNNP